MNATENGGGIASRVLCTLTSAIGPALRHAATAMDKTAKYIEETTEDQELSQAMLRAIGESLRETGSATPAYFHVPDGVPAFHLSLEATPPGETALAALDAPDGQQIAQFDCTSVSVDRKSIPVPRGNAGWWKIRISRAPTGALDDAWIKAGDELSGFFSLSPDQAMLVEPL